MLYVYNHLFFMLFNLWLFCFFKQKTAYEMRISDWSSDVCSSDLRERQQAEQVDRRLRIGRGQILDPQRERLVAHLDRQHQHLVERVEDGDLEQDRQAAGQRLDLRSEEHTSELQSLMRLSYAVFCLKKKLYLSLLPLSNCLSLAILTLESQP